jgi:hypothetical protein
MFGFEQWLRAGVIGHKMYGCELTGHTRLEQGKAQWNQSATETESWMACRQSHFSEVKSAIALQGKYFSYLI